MADKPNVDDAKFEAILGSLRVTDRDLLCPSDHQITRICSNPKCKQALHCGDLDCKGCGAKIHNMCPSFPLSSITSILNERIFDHKEFLSKVMEIDKELIEAVESSSKEFASCYQISSLPSKIEKVVRSIYRDKRLKEVTGQEGKEFCENIQDVICSSNKKLITSLEEYRMAITKMIKEYSSIKKMIFKMEIPPPQIFNSMILKEKDEMTKKQINFMLKELKNPKRLDLLYRGSENNFKASLFHEKCGDVENTFTLIRTEFGKTIAGFSPYKYHSVDHKEYVSNQDGGCFLLSLDNEEKMIPIDTTKQIQNWTGNGPTFGQAKSDIYISDECNKGSDSFANFPRSYNTVDKKYTNNQDSYKSFSGATKGNNFKVIQYQVFQVVW